MSLYYTKKIYRIIMELIIEEFSYAHTLTVLQEEISKLVTGQIPLQELIIVTGSRFSKRGYIATEDGLILFDNFDNNIDYHYYINDLLSNINDLFKIGYPEHATLYYDGSVKV